METFRLIITPAVIEVNHFLINYWFDAMKESYSFLVNSVHNLEKFLEPFLKNLDPSLFQNIILGILAIFIPFAIVFLTDILDSKKHRSDFERMVLNEEVLGAKKVFWLSIFGIGILAFFGGRDASVGEKLLAILITLFLVIIFGRFFRKTLRFSEGYKSVFELSFLRGLNLSGILRFRNKIKMERMVRAWNSFWSEKSPYNESEFTRIFIKHIEDAIENEKYNLAVSLAQAYQKNINERNRFSIGHEMLPKLFEWNEKLLKLDRDLIIRKNYAVDNSFWNWRYFQQEFFPEITKALLFDRLGSYQLFACFNEQIKNAVARLEKTENEDERQWWWDYIVGLLKSFFMSFFENIAKAPERWGIWRHYFPEGWKIKSGNSENRVSRVILHEFLDWVRQRIQGTSKRNHDEELTEVINGLFPNVHRGLFPIFLIFFLSPDVKYTIQKDPSFFIVNSIISWSGEKSDAEIQEMSNQMEQSQKSDTIDIILSYFRDSRLLSLNRDDILEEEYSEWNTYSEQKKQEIMNRIRRGKMQGILDELKSKEILDLCKNTEIYETRRLEFIELIRLLLERTPA